MIYIKLLAISLLFTSFCMADIYGRVTNTRGIAIPRAVIQLEKEDLTAVSDTEGYFAFSTTAIRPVDRTSIQSGLTVTGNLLKVTIAERTSIEVEMYDLCGKVLSRQRKTLDAGAHSITQPSRGSGILLYKVKSGNLVYLAKGNQLNKKMSWSVGAVFNRLTNGTFAQASKEPAGIDDVLVARKAGYIDYWMSVTSSEKKFLEIKMIVCADSIKDVDGNWYQAVAIGNQVWTVENFRSTRYTDSTPVPLDTSAATWRYASTPKYCIYDNTTNSDSIRRFGALYNWFVVNPANPNKIAPPGWHVPSDAEWLTLGKYLVANGYNWNGSSSGNDFAKSLAAKTDWCISSIQGSVGNDLSLNNRSCFGAFGAGFRSSDASFERRCSGSAWWSTVEKGALAWGCSIRNEYDDFNNDYYQKSYGLSLRLVKN